MQIQYFPHLLLGASLLLTSGSSSAEILPSVAPEEVGLSSARLMRLGDTLQGYVDDERLAGAVVLIARQGHVPFFRAFGHADVEAEEPMRRETIFRIASQTKALVSTGVMMLQEEGRLLIDRPVSDYLPEFRNTTVAVAEDSSYTVVPAERPITIRHLLTHTAGIGYGGGPARDRWTDAGIRGWYFAHLDEPIRHTVRRLAGLPFDAQPGTEYVYGYNTDILGALIEEVSGQRLDRFLAERIFEPLRMADTHFYLPAGKADRLAAVYGWGLERAPEESSMFGQGAYVEGPRTSFSGGAGLLSTAADYARFLQAMLNGGILGERRILSPTTVDLMTVDHLDEVEFPWWPGVGFGLGFWVVEELGRSGLPTSLGAYGWGGAYHTTYWVDPEEDLVVVYMTQLIPARDIDDHDKLRALVYQAIVD
jgi:CubicO group peptidase (beta-lactamase class C family)